MLTKSSVKRHGSAELESDTQWGLVTASLRELICMLFQRIPLTLSEKEQIALSTMHQESGKSEISGAGDVKTITQKQFCAIVGISEGTAIAMRKAGKLGHCRVGRRVLYIYPRHVEEFLVRAERKPKAA